MTNTELLSMLNNQNKPQEHQFDLIITSPMFNELGVMLGKVFAVVIWPLYYINIYWRGHVFYSNNTFLTCQWWTYSINVSRWEVNMASVDSILWKVFFYRISRYALMVWWRSCVNNKQFKEFENYFYFSMQHELEMIDLIESFEVIFIFRGQLTNLIYQMVIKPYFFVQPQLDTLRNAFQSSFA